MSFHVQPDALRTYAGQIGDAKRVADAANTYVKQNGSFSFHQQGLIGWLAPGHDNLMGDLDRMLTHLGELGDTSRAALTQTADHYQHSDRNAEAALDATYPEVARSHPDLD
jgi:hypothetical protein